MEKSIRLEPYIMYHKNSCEYTAYIPYYNSNKEFIEHSTPSGRIAIYLGLPYDWSDYNPSYAYMFGNGYYEIGIKGKDLDKIKDSIKNIQMLLENHNCEVKYCEPIITNVD